MSSAETRSRQVRLHSQSGEQGRGESRPGNRRSVQCALRRRMEPVDTGCDHRLQRTRHVDVGSLINAQIAATAADQYVALAQVPDDLLGEKWVSRCSLSDQLG